MQSPPCPHHFHTHTLFTQLTNSLSSIQLHRCPCCDSLWATYRLGFFSSSLASSPGAGDALLGGHLHTTALGSALVEARFVLNIWVRALSGWSLCTEVIALLWKDDNCISVKDGFYSVVFHICVRDKSRIVLTTLLFCKTLLVRTVSVCKCLSYAHTALQPALYFRYLSVFLCSHSKTGFPFHFCVCFSSSSFCRERLAALRAVWQPGAWFQQHGGRTDPPPSSPGLPKPFICSRPSY